jgi:hypothetical protein
MRETSTRRERIIYIVEEKQIQDFVHRVSNDEDLRKELAQKPDEVIMREGFSPRVAQIVTRLVPHLTLHQFVDIPLYWWY